VCVLGKLPANKDDRIECVSCRVWLKRDGTRCRREGK